MNNAINTMRAIDTYFEAAYMWTYRNLDEIREPQTEIPFEECETIARALMAKPVIFWDCQPHPLELTGQIKNDITLYVASAIRQANRSLQATAEANHRAFHATVQAHLKDPRSYAEIEQARRVA